MHTAAIGQIATDAANRYIVTDSNDKTVRIWELATGRLLQTIRVPIGPGNEGKIYAVAVSPDGNTVACGGWTGYEWDKSDSIYLFDRSNGQLTRRIGNLENTVDYLAFSADGRFLAATLGKANGLRVYKTTDWSLVATDTDYGDDSYGADFDAQGRLVIASQDGFIRLYDSDFKLLAKEQARGGKTPFRVRFAPDGGQVAVGFDDSTKVTVLSGKDLSFEFGADTTGVDNGSISAVAWSIDGKFLFAGGKWWKNGNPIRRWAGGGRGAYTDILTGAGNTVMDAIRLQDGGIAFCTYDPAWGVIDSRGQRTLLKQPAIADYRSNLQGFLLSANGSVVQFSYQAFGKSPARFSVANRKLDIGVSSGGEISPRRTKAPGLDITGWEETYAPKLNGKDLKLAQYEKSFCLAVAPDGDSFLLGTSWNLRLFDKDGREKWNVVSPSAAWAINIAGNGQVAAAAFGDGTIRWYRMRDGQEVMAFFPHPDRKRWVLWTPSGYYDCSPGGEDLIGWHVNRGKDQAADFFPASRFRDLYYRPDVIAKLIDALDEQRALKLANAEAKAKPAEKTAVAERLPPVVRLISPVDGTMISGSQVVTRYSVRTPSGEAVTSVRALVDGRPAAAAYDLNVVAPDEKEDEITVPMPPHDCLISILAENQFGASEPSTARVKWSATKPTEAFKPRLYVLAIGISKYQDASIELDYAHKDAVDFGAALKAQEGGIYREVLTKVLINEKATKEAILDGLDWIQHETTSRDVAMVFLSGHGVNSPTRDYYFLPHDYNRDHLKATGVPFTDIRTTVANIPGKALFFIDSCHSGNVMGTGKTKGIGDITAVINELASAENGAIVFSASTGRQVSWEDAKWENGAFTKALLEAIKGEADWQKSGRITVKMIDLYISERVKKLTEGRQSPTTQVPPTVPDFPVAVAR